MSRLKAQPYLGVADNRCCGVRIALETADRAPLEGVAGSVGADPAYSENGAAYVEKRYARNRRNRAQYSAPQP